MRKFSALFIFFFIFQLGITQNVNKRNITSPVFLGGLEQALEADDPLNTVSFQQYIVNEVIKDKSLSLSDFSEEVLFKFKVNKNGVVRKVKVINGISSELDLAFVNAIKATSEMWQPAEKDGKLASVDAELTININDEELAVLFVK